MSASTARNFRSHAREDARVRVVHLPVARHHAGVVDVEAVRVLHDELARAHHAEAGPDLVAELGLDLVEVDRHLPVAADFLAHDVGDHFLVRRTHDEVPLVAVFEAQHVGAHLREAPRFLPQLRRLDDGHHELDGPCAVHLLANDLLDLAQRDEAERHPRVEAAAQLLDHARAKHQLLADDVGLGGGFLLGREVELGYAHAGAPEKNVNYNKTLRRLRRRYVHVLVVRRDARRVVTHDPRLHERVLDVVRAAA